MPGTTANTECSDTLKARNGQVIAASEGYKQLAACKNGIESVRKNAPGAEIVTE